MMGDHLIDGEFQSDKYPTTPRGKVPLSVKDKLAQPFLWAYADAHEPIDKEFSDDLRAALLAAGYRPDALPAASGNLREAALEAAAKAIADTIEVVEWEDVPEDSEDGASCRRDYRIMARAALDAALPAADGGWRPIEEAPKDGTPVDLWLAGEGRRLIDARWVEKPSLVGWFLPMGGPDARSWRIIHDHNAPTHWCPPPPVPQSGEDEG